MLSAAPRFLPFSTHQISWLSRTVLIHCDLDLVNFKVPLFNIQFWLLRCLDFLQRAAQVSENQSEVAKSPRSDRILFSENLSSAHAFIIYVLHCNLNIAIALLVTLMTKTNMTTLTMTAMTIIGCNL